MGLGSNAGSSFDILEVALTKLSGFLNRMQCSSLYCTSPQYIFDQPDFLNLVITGFTGMNPLDLLKRTQEIETALGRDRSRERPMGERTLDIDILLYGSTVMESDDLKIPHPGMLERAFVLVPLFELDPELVHPVTGTLLSAALPAVKDQGIYLHGKAAL